MALNTTLGRMPKDHKKLAASSFFQFFLHFFRLQ